MVIKILELNKVVTSLSLYECVPSILHKLPLQYSEDGAITAESNCVSAIMSVRRPTK